MMSKNFFGMVIGIIIVSVGSFLFVSNLGFIPIQVNEEIDLDTSRSYNIHSDKHGTHIMNITGNKFNLELISPAHGLQIPNTFHSKKVFLEWVHLEDGYSLINVQNIGNSTLNITATFEKTVEPFERILHISIIIIGLVIIVIVLNFTSKNTKN